jgi:hypothetical protein
LPRGRGCARATRSPNYPTPRLTQAQRGQARAARDRVYAGPRKEQVDALARDTDVAKANLIYAQQQFSRTSQLTATGLASH